MKAKREKLTSGLLGLLMCLALLTGAFSLTVFADEGQSTSLQTTSIEKDETSLASEGSSSELETSLTPEPELTEDEELPRVEPPAGAPAMDLYPVYNYQDILDAVVAIGGGAGHIQLMNDIRIDDTIVIPLGAEVDLSGTVGTEKLLLAVGVDETRHFNVYGTLSLYAVDLDGEGRTGGIVVSGVQGAGSLVMYDGARIGNCYQIGDPVYGGGVHVADGANFDMYGGVIEDNVLVCTGLSSGGGAGVCVDRNSLFTLHGGIIRNNTCDWVANIGYIGPGNGGGVSVLRASFTMLGGTISGNKALAGSGVYGWGFSDEGHTIKILGGTITGNGYGMVRLNEDKHATYGGGVHTEHFMALQIEDTEISYNAAVYGGGLSVDSGTTGTNSYFDDATVDGASIVHNSGVTGGGIYFAPMAHRKLIITNSDISHNQGHPDTGNAGGIFTRLYGSSELRLEDCTVTYNSVPGSGGGIYLYTQETAERTYLDGVCFENNRTGNPPYYFDDAYDALHSANITGLKGLSTPFNHTLDSSTRLHRAYNNYDIYLFAGDPVEYFTVDVYLDGVWQFDIHTLKDLPMAEPVGITPPGGYALDGWYTGDDYTTKWDFAQPVEDDMELHARLKSTAVTNDVTFYRNDGTPAVHHVQQAVVAGGEVLRPTDPVRQGHLFWKWTVAADENSATFNFATPMPAQPLELYAQYTVLTYRVTFDYSQVRTSQQLVYQDVDYGDRVSPVSTYAEGYSFIGWQYGNSYWNFNTAMPARNITLVGVWSKDSTPPPVSSSSSSTSGGSTSLPPASSSQPVSSGASSGSEVVVPSTSVPVSSLPPAPPEEPRGESFTINLFGTEIPIGDMSSTEGWSILNLLIAILLFLSAGINVIFILRRKRVPQLNMDDLEYTEGGSMTRLGRLTGWLASGVGALALVLWPILENLNGRGMLFSRWTPLFIALAVLQTGLLVAACVLGRKAGTLHSKH